AAERQRQQALHRPRPRVLEQLQCQGRRVAGGEVEHRDFAEHGGHGDRHYSRAPSGPEASATNTRPSLGAYFPGGSSFSSTITSPPAGVMTARSVAMSARRLMKRTAESHIAALKPSGNRPPNGGSSFFGSYRTSSGLVHGTATPASTIRSVFDT